MESFHTQREYGAAVESHYGLKNVTKVSMPTNEHDEPLVVHISMLVSKEDIKGIAARFAGEGPAPKLDPNCIVLAAVAQAYGSGALIVPALSVYNLGSHDPQGLQKVMVAGAIPVIKAPESVITRTTEVGDICKKFSVPEDAIGDVESCRKVVHVGVPDADTIREMLEPGAMYLPASTVRDLPRYGYINEAKLVEFGGITAKKPDEGNNS